MFAGTSESDLGLHRNASASKRSSHDTCASCFSHARCLALTSFTTWDPGWWPTPGVRCFVSAQCTRVRNLLCISVWVLTTLLRVVVRGGRRDPAESAPKLTGFPTRSVLATRAGGGNRPSKYSDISATYKVFGAINELTTTVTAGVLVTAAPFPGGADRALGYSNHRGAAENILAVWETLGANVRRQKCLVIQKLAPYEIPNRWVSPLGAVVTHKVRIINGFSFGIKSKKSINRRAQHRHRPGRRPQMFVRRSTTQIPHRTSQSDILYIYIYIRYPDQLILYERRRRV